MYVVLMRDNWKRAMLSQYFNSITKRVVPVSWIFDDTYIRGITKSVETRIAPIPSFIHVRACPGHATWMLEYKADLYKSRRINNPGTV